MFRNFIFKIIQYVEHLSRNVSKEKLWNILRMIFIPNANLVVLKSKMCRRLPKMFLSLVNLLNVPQDPGS